MKRNTLFVILSVLGVGVIATLVILLSSTAITEDELEISYDNTTETIFSTRVIKKEKDLGWTSLITAPKEQEFLYPVTELHINLN